jgi:Skp family chaperone for outer membrane proteins
MKKLFLFMAMLAAAFCANAQLGTIDTKRVMESMPEVAKIDTLIQKELNQYNVIIIQKQKDIQLQQQVADSLFKVQPRGNASRLANDKLKDMKQDATIYQSKANKDFTEYRNLLYKPYIDKVTTAIKSVALRHKYTQIIDIQQVPFIYTTKEGDITEEVIEDLKK